jgi:molybdopterin synthase sulfur carrier subunit
MITVLYFAGLREQMNIDREQIKLPAGVTSLGELRAHLCERGSPWSNVLDADSLVMMSLNQAMADSNVGIKSGDEIAFFPPVTGG